MINIRVLNTLPSALYCGALVLFAVVPVRAGSFNVNFGNLEIPAPSSSFGAASGQSGLWVQQPQVGALFNLTDVSGSQTGVSMSMGVNILGPPLGSGPNQSTADNISLLRNQTFVNFFQGGPWSLTFSNMDTGTYSFYYYAGTKQDVSTGALTVNGLFGPNIQGSPNFTLNEGTDWEVVTGVEVTNGILQVAETQNTPLFSGLAGLQIVQTSGEVPNTNTTPEPSTLWLAGGMLILLIARLIRDIEIKA